MAPETLHTHATDRSTQPRRPFKGLAVNSIGSRPNGVCKPASRNPTNTPTKHRNRVRHSSKTKLVNLRPQQIESATAIFEKLLTIGHVSKRTPTLRLPSHYVHCDQYELEYPALRLWRLCSDPALLKLTKNMLHCLRDDLIDTVSKLYEANIAFIWDLATFSVARKISTGGAVYVPFLDTFDFDRHPDDQTIAWEDLKNEQLSFVNKHFDVLEFIAQLSEPSALSLPPRIRTDLRPDIVVKVLELRNPHDELRNWIICSVSGYSPELGRLAVRHACRRARTLPPRTELAEKTTNDSIRSHCSAVSHVLGLLDQCIQDRQVKESDLVDRAELLVVHAVLLIHLHAKAVGVIHSRGLLEMNGDGTPEAYTSCEDFHVVVTARSLAMRAVSQLTSDNQLDIGVTRFLRANG